jgi:hypothetical protein
MAVEDTNGQPLHFIGKVTFKITIEGHDGLLGFCPVGFSPISELTHRVIAALGFYSVGFLPRWVFAMLSFCRVC